MYIRESYSQKKIKNEIIKKKIVDVGLVPFRMGFYRNAAGAMATRVPAKSKRKKRVD